MAQAFPPLSTLIPTSLGEHAELAVLRLLADGLGDDYRLFHGVDWVDPSPVADGHGELDVVVVNRAGDVALLEVKSGALELIDGEWHKRYGGSLRNVVRQARWQFSGIQRRLRELGLAVRLLHLLVLPDHRCGPDGSAAYPRDRIVDADEYADLPGRLDRLLGRGQERPERQRVLAFFADRLAVAPDVSALAGSLQRRVTQISGGLAEWVPRIDSPSGVIRVIGTAGSGKTQLALALLGRAVARGAPAAYVCFNRPLADHMRAIAPRPVDVATYHQLAWIAAGRPAGAPDHERLSADYAAQLATAPPDLDLLLIDELQDFRLPWVQALLQRVRPQGQVVLLDDPDQRLYEDREEIDIPDAVTVRCEHNYRSPQRLVQTLNALRLASRPVRALGPYVGQEPDFLTWDQGGQDLLVATEQAVRRALEQGHALQDIWLLSWRGVRHSRLFALDRLGPWRLSRFTGEYDTRGEPVWTEGDLRLDTVRRAKGQAAPVVVLSEVDFDTLDDLSRRLLFVGMTRARLHLALVLSAAAGTALARRLQDADVD